MRSATFPLVGGRVHLSQPQRAHQVQEYLQKKDMVEDAQREFTILESYAADFRTLDDLEGTDLNTEQPGVVVLGRGVGRARWTGSMHRRPSAHNQGLEGVRLMEWDQPNGETSVYEVDATGRGVKEDRSARGQLLRRFMLNPNGTVTIEDYA